MANSERSDLLPGTLEMLILKSLTLGPMHGYGIAQHIQRLSREKLRIEEGSLYPALYRLEERGLVRASWGISDEGRRAKFYQLSAAGRKALTRESSAWREYSGAIDLVLQGAGL